MIFLGYEKVEIPYCLIPQSKSGTSLLIFAKYHKRLHPHLQQAIMPASASAFTSNALNAAVSAFVALISGASANHGMTPADFADLIVTKIHSGNPEIDISSMGVYHEIDMDHEIDVNEAIKFMAAMREMKPIKIKSDGSSAPSAVDVRTAMGSARVSVMLQSGHGYLVPAFGLCDCYVYNEDTQIFSFGENRIDCDADSSDDDSSGSSDPSSSDPSSSDSDSD